MTKCSPLYIVLALGFYSLIAIFFFSVSVLSPGVIPDILDIIDYMDRANWPKYIFQENWQFVTKIFHRLVCILGQSIQKLRGIEIYYSKDC